MTKRSLVTDGGWTDGLGREVLTVGDLARPASYVSVSTPCSEVDRLFRGDLSLSCVLVRHELTDRVGLISRGRFHNVMAGPLGYGRMVHDRRTVSTVADWHPVIVHGTETVADVAAMVASRNERDDLAEVLVRRVDGSLGQVPVTELFQTLAAEFAHQALTDSLTGLANRAAFMAHLGRLCGRASEGQRVIAVLFVDLDGFKAINDAYGHNRGDEVLRQTAARLRRCFRDDDVIARLGGDEFAVVLALEAGSAGVRTAEALVGRTLAALTQPFGFPGDTIAGRASIGVAISTATEADPETLLREADLAMYRAKRAGGCTAEIVDEVGTALTPAGGRPDHDHLRRALEHGEFVVHYQPIVDAHTQRLVSVEALVRWAHPQFGLIAPSDFLDAVEAAGLAVDLDRYVLQAASAQMIAWRSTLGSDAPPRFNVNLCAAHLLDENLADGILTTLAVAGLPGHTLRLEIPEAATTAHVQCAQPALRELRAAGIGIALDDVGAGASSLDLVTQLALDGLKIDRRFVAGMLDDHRDLAVVRMLHELARALSLTVTSEGVETAAQLLRLQQLAHHADCYIQGFLIGHPAPAAELPLPWPTGTMQNNEPANPTPISTSPT